MSEQYLAAAPSGEVRLRPRRIDAPAAAPALEPAAVETPATSWLRIRNLHKKYRKGPVAVPVLRGVDLDVNEGEFLSIVGQSGSGKSTLLHLLGTLDAPDDGEITFDGRRIDNLRRSARDALRNREIGLVFQFYHLLPELSAVENVLMPLMIGRGVFGYWLRRREYHERARQLLELMGLGHRLRHRPREMSGGEMQRTAIARALITQPRLLLADEPTGNLDGATGRGIIELLRMLNAEQQLTVLMVTHDSSLARETDRVVHLVEGRVAA